MPAPSFGGGVATYAGGPGAEQVVHGERGRHAKAGHVRRLIRRDLVRQFDGREYSLATVPAEDPVVYDMICDADTIGTFQIESRMAEGTGGVGAGSLRAYRWVAYGVPICIARASWVPNDPGRIGEPRAEDGFATWGVLDEWIAVGEDYPIVRGP